MKNFKNYSNLLLFSLLMLALFAGSLNAQERAGNNAPSSGPSRSDSDLSSSRFIDRMFFGGGLGLSFTSSNTYFLVSPLVGYKITEKLHAGVGFTYIYRSSKVILSNGIQDKFTSSDYGVTLFSRYFILENFFAHVEYEYLNVGYPIEYSYGEMKVLRENINSVFVGGGYAQRLGPNAAVIISVLWNLNETPNSPYINPLFRLGFTAGF